MFQLKPYVSYKVSDVTRPKWTAQDLFDATYATKVTDDFNNKKLDVDKVTGSVKMLKSEDN